MKQFIFILFLLLSKSVICQITFRVDNFSDSYYGEIFISDTTEVFSEGWVAIYDKETNEELIKENSEELTYTLHEGEILANVKELPYGEQSQILHEDYNFDGVTDFAVMDGQNSCYHGPSFQIYLATNDGFVHSPEFTELAQAYCGMFFVDNMNQTIHTMTKSGCCWHQYSEFKVKDNRPYPIKIVEESTSHMGITWDYVEEELINGEMVKTTYQQLAFNFDDDDLLLSFEFENKKTMWIIRTDQMLYYIFTDTDDKVELLYNESFQYSRAQNTLTFSNHDTRYIIHDEKIVVKTPGKTFEMKAAKDTRKGTLEKLKNMDFDNVTNTDD